MSTDLQTALAQDVLDQSWLAQTNAALKHGITPIPPRKVVGQGQEAVGVLRTLLERIKQSRTTTETTQTQVASPPVSPPPVAPPPVVVPPYTPPAPDPPLVPQPVQKAAGWAARIAPWVLALGATGGGAGIAALATQFWPEDWWPKGGSSERPPVTRPAEEKTGNLIEYLEREGYNRPPLVLEE